jgi:tight adherence protein B
MVTLIATVWIFVVCLFAIEVALYTYNSIRHPNRRKIRQRLQNLSAGAYEAHSPDILRKGMLSEVSFLDRILSQIPAVERLEILIRQSNSTHSAGFYLLLFLFLGLTGFIVISFTTQHVLYATLGALLLSAMPFANLQLKKKKRVHRFQKQLPEALELIARALKAGHAFTSGMKLAAEEFKDPLGTEFDEALDEINFGVSVSDALRNLTKRIDCPDLRFFAVSVILQRETGGNLAEIMESLARLIRERFKFQGKVNVLAAEGKFSALILLALPFFIGLVVRLLNPDYLQILFTERAGRVAMAAAVGSMILGTIFIKRMIKISV